MPRQARHDRVNKGAVNSSNGSLQSGPVPPSPTPHHHHHRHPHPGDAEFLRAQLGQSHVPTGPTADVYRIAGYQQNLIGDSDKPECLVIAAKWDSGLKWPDPNNPQPTDLLWNGGVTAGLWWDGTFYRDASRYPAGGQLFWCAYFKPGTGPGNKNGYWINFGCAYSHLVNDDPAQLLAGASQRLFWESPHPSASRPAFAAHDGGVSQTRLPPEGEAASMASGEGQWKLVIEATDYVTYEVREVWHGTKDGGNDPVGVYTRIAGCDPTAMLTVA